MSTNVLVYTRNGNKGSWSRYKFPFDVEAFAQLGDDLYVKYTDDLGTRVNRISLSATTDGVSGGSQSIPGIVQWNWLDCGQPGVTKKLLSVDLVGTGSPSISIGYDQASPAGSSYTTPHAISPADTLTGGPVPLPVVGPSFSLKVTYNAAGWALQAASLNMRDTRGGL
jgi:hypothetical protein